MKSPKDIFKNRRPLSEEEMKAYLEGNLSDAEKHEIELKISEDEFNSDAMEGAEIFGAGAFAGFDEVKTKMDSHIASNSSKWQFKHTIISLVLVVVAMTALSSVLFTNNGFVTKLSDSKLQSPPDKLETPVNVNPVEPDTKSEETLISEAVEISEQEIDDAIELPEIELVTSEKVAIASPVVIDTLDNNVAEEVEEEVIKLLKVKVDSTALLPVTPDNDQLVYSNVKLVFLHKFTLVDYSVIYTDKLSVRSVVMSGTDASLENADDSNHDEFPQMTTQEVSYLDYLETTQKYFSDNDFKSALKGYKVILKHYPADLNAIFYSGLCYYNLGKHKLAIKYFDLAYKHNFNTFKIDAEWYKAQTYYQWGKQVSCRKVLNKIIEDNKYYAKRAKELLLKLD